MQCPIRLSKFDQMHEMYGGRRSTSSGTQETSLWIAKVRDLRQLYVLLEGHRCYIQPETKKKRKNPTPDEEEMPENGYDVTGFFDTECRQGERDDEDEAVEECMKELLLFDLKCRQENGNQEPNLCVAQDEAGKEWIFEGNKTIDEFCEWLFTTEHAGCTVMAHKLQG